MSLKTAGLMVSIGAIFTGAKTLASTKTAVTQLETKIKKLKVQKANLKVNSNEYLVANKRIKLLNNSIKKLKKNQATIEANYAKRDKFKSSILDKLALGATILAPLKVSIDFESSMADVKKVVDFKDNKEYKKFEQEVLKLSTEIPIKATGIAEIVAAGGQLGIAKEKLVSFTTTTAKMATAFDMLPKEAGEASAKLMNIFALNIKGVNSLGDAINHLSDNSAAKAKNIITVLAKIGGNAKVFGLSAKQASSLAGAFLALGKPPEVAATGINAMLTKLSTADAQGKKFQNALNKIGIDAQSLKQNIQEDAQSAIMSFLETLNKVPKEEKMNILVDLFGMEYADDLALLTGGIDNYKKSINLLSKEQNYQNSMQKEFENRSKTTANNLTKLISNITRIGINIGSLLLPALNAVLSPLSLLSSKIGDLVVKFPTISTGLGAITIGTIGMSLAISVGAYAWTFFSNALARIKNIITLTTTAIKWLTASKKIGIFWTKAYSFAQKTATLSTKALSKGILFLNKTFKIAKVGVRTLIGATGIGLLFVAAGLIYEYWTPVSDFFSNFWKKIKATFKIGIDVVSNIFISPIETITNIWDGMFTWLSKKLEWVGKSIDWIKGVGSKIGNFFGDNKVAKKTALATVTATSLVTSPVPISNIQQPLTKKEQPSYISNNKKQNQINHNNYYITINVYNAKTNIDIEKAVKKALRDINRDKFNREIS